MRPFVPPSFFSNIEPFPIWDTECRITNYKFRIPNPDCPITFYFFSSLEHESRMRAAPQIQTRIVYFLPSTFYRKNRHA
jgi:hypothetical protein